MLVVLLAGWCGFMALGQLSCLSLARVVAQVEAMKHFLSATAAPISAKYCLDNLMPVTAVEACRNLDA